MVELNMEHVLILVIAVFLLYHLMNRCSCNNGFSVGGVKLKHFNDCRTDADFEERFECSKLISQNNTIDELTNRATAMEAEVAKYMTQMDKKCNPDGICRYC